ncbi:hypothetical protein L6R44_10405 [Enterobacter cloacae complex sp. ECC445]|nr:hypothetical protein [Enterobacter cloacae complex sp. ECC445]MCG0456516.1 hypothetical protein [Enterobacter cloacae complex sp. ECC445]
MSFYECQAGLLITAELIYPLIMGFHTSDQLLFGHRDVFHHFLLSHLPSFNQPSAGTVRHCRWQYPALPAECPAGIVVGTGFYPVCLQMKFQRRKRISIEIPVTPDHRTAWQGDIADNDTEMPPSWTSAMVTFRYNAAISCACAIEIAVPFVTCSLIEFP